MLTKPQTEPVQATMVNENECLNQANEAIKNILTSVGVEEVKKSESGFDEFAKLFNREKKEYTFQMFYQKEENYNTFFSECILEHASALNHMIIITPKSPQDEPKSLFFNDNGKIYPKLFFMKSRKSELQKIKDQPIQIEEEENKRLRDLRFGRTGGTKKQRKTKSKSKK
jgi:hypothetical protein